MTLCWLYFPYLIQYPFIRSIRFRRRNCMRKPSNWRDLTAKQRVIDAYCGIGTIGMVAAKTCKRSHRCGTEPGCRAGCGKECKTKPDSAYPFSIQGRCRSILWIRLAAKKESADVVSHGSTEKRKHRTVHAFHDLHETQKNRLCLL